MAMGTPARSNCCISRRRSCAPPFPLDPNEGLLLGATGSQLLLDGVPLEGAPAEKQFAQLLSAAGLASVQFFASVTRGRAGALRARVSHRQGQTRRAGAAIEGCSYWRAGNPHQRNLFCGHGFAAEGRQHGGATGGRFAGQGSGQVHEHAERPAEVAGIDCGGGGCEG